MTVFFKKFISRLWTVLTKRFRLKLFPYDRFSIKTSFSVPEIIDRINLLSNLKKRYVSSNYFRLSKVRKESDFEVIIKGTYHKQISGEIIINLKFYYSLGVYIFMLFFFGMMGSGVLFALNDVINNLELINDFLLFFTFVNLFWLLFLATFFALVKESKNELQKIFKI